MSLQELKDQVLKLQKSDHLVLVSAILKSLQEAPTVSRSDRSSAIQLCKSLLSSDYLG